MARQLITEHDVVEAAKRGARSIAVASDAVITPSAWDAALRHKVELRESVRSTESAGSSPLAFVVHSPVDKRSPNASRIIALGSDHGGYLLKETLKKYLLDLGFTVSDVGTNSEEPCDYPDFAYAVASMVADNRAEKGIMIDGVGVASAIVANKVPGVRAVPCFNEFVAQSSREHNDANVLTLGARVLGTEIAKAIVAVWVDTWFGGGRHKGRVQKITEIEKKFSSQK